MEVSKGNIYSIFNSNTQYMVPIYQRFYSWEESNCERLWNDIVSMQKQAKPSHFVGAVVSIVESAVPGAVAKFQVIDGQQRLTTLTLLLLALRDYISKNPGESATTPEGIEQLYIKNNASIASGDSVYKLSLTDKDKETLICLIEKKPMIKEPSKRIIDNYDYFCRHIEKKEISADEVLTAVGKLQIASITLQREYGDNPQAIFESLNSTGKGLSQTDLIRNYVLMGINATEQEYVYTHCWRPMEKLFSSDEIIDELDSFFRDYLTLKNASISKIADVYEDFKIYMSKASFASTRELCEDLLKFAGYYTDIIYCNSSDTEIQAIYEEIVGLRMTTAYPFLIKVRDDYENKLIDVDVFKEILRLSVSYVFRRGICDIPTNSLNKTFSSLRKSIDESDYLNSFKAALYYMDDYKRFPNDVEFKESFKNKDIYTSNVCNYVLTMLEDFGTKKHTDITGWTIEHIMPQNPNLSDDWKKELGVEWERIHDQYLHKIGNLTLTAYNSELSDNKFQDKLDMEGGFKESGLRLNEYVVLQTNWNEKTINERANLLTAKAIDIWPYLNLDDATKLKYKPSQNTQTEYSLDSYQLNAFNKMLYEKMDVAILGLDSKIKREFKKLYISYKYNKSIVDIIIQNNGLKLMVNVKFSEVNDPNHICKDVTEKGHWGIGDTQTFVYHTNEIDQAIDIIKQALEKQK